MAQGITPSGIAVHNRVEGTTERRLHAKVVDNILNYPTLFSRFMGRGMPFMGKTFDYTVKITESGLGEFFSGLETLSTAASDTTIELSYAHTAFSQPVVLPMLESFANTGPEATINLDQFKLDEAVAEAKEVLGEAIYGTGSGDQPLGLGAIVDDGTDVTTIGGQSRSVYAALKATRTASGGTLSLSKMATLWSAIVAAGAASEEPSIGVTTKTIFDLYESLLQPQVRAEYASVGFNALGIRSDAPVKSRSVLKGAAGFNSLSYRGIPIIADDKATSGVLWFLNENYIGWRGRTIVPSKYRGEVSKVNLGTPSTLEGVSAAPSKYHGWFSQRLQMMPNQAGMIGRYYVIGQMCASQFRRHGRLDDIAGV
jgi:hypothetical protein